MDHALKMASYDDDISGEVLPDSSVKTLNGKFQDESEKKDNCYHSWHNYTGLRESYEYCSKCPATRPLVDERKYNE